MRGMHPSCQCRSAGSVPLVAAGQRRCAVAAAAAASGGGRRSSLDGGVAAPLSHQQRPLQQQAAAAGPSVAEAATLCAGRALAAAPLTSPAGAAFAWAAAMAAMRPLAAPRAADAAPLRLPEVFVILFSAGGADVAPVGEGIYSLRMPGLDGLPSETILAFERRTDCERYSALVEAEGIVDGAAAAVVGLPPCELAAFCADAGYGCRLELAGSALLPPAASVPMTDFERAARLRAGTGFRVLEEEPPRGPAPAATGQHPGAPSAQATQAPSRRPRAHAPPPLGSWLQRPRPMSGGIADLVAALEVLLPRDS
ncbi:hypothetical protein Rsub_10269 [Raphidocelis subcapitata]|uniref:Uncharacterized protein n=1 Tax=Raphidocelis subcapitata TaxID=307507 RepID=A0A2V0PDW3_9CHLO|nr:hypothetical protein Rsub_10269 [Raphidocelis subcapitata]|eukprot:GBF98041.1 hypothetical protein Rsub_10269 [Raphidocelis subcapitata]